MAAMLSSAVGDEWPPVFPGPCHAFYAKPVVCCPVHRELIIRQEDLGGVARFVMEVFAMLDALMTVS